MGKKSQSPKGQRGAKDATGRGRAGSRSQSDKGKTAVAQEHARGRRTPSPGSDPWNRLVGADMERLEGRNPVIEALRASKRVRLLWVDERARIDDKLNEVFALAKRRGIEVQPVDREHLDLLTNRAVHNGVVAAATPLPQRTLSQVLGRTIEQGRDPFFVLLDEVQQTHNLGAVLRTAEATQVDAVVVPVRRGALVSPAVTRVAMGAAEHVPVVREGLSSALATLRRAGLTIVGFEARGNQSVHDVDLTGPIALVFGGEDKGLGQAVRNRCDVIAHLPMGGDWRVST